MNSPLSYSYIESVPASDTVYSAHEPGKDCRLRETVESRWTRNLGYCSGTETAETSRQRQRRPKRQCIRGDTPRNEPANHKALRGLFTHRAEDKRCRGTATAPCDGTPAAGDIETSTDRRAKEGTTACAGVSGIAAYDEWEREDRACRAGSACATACDCG